MRHTNSIFFHFRFIIKVAIATGFFFVGVMYRSNFVGIRGPVTNPILYQKDDTIISGYMDQIPDDSEISFSTPQTFSKTQIDETIKNIYHESEISGKEHNVAIDNPEEILQNICIYYKKICLFTYFFGNFTEQEKLIYQSIVIQTIKYMDTFSQSNRKLHTTLTEISLFKEQKGGRGYAAGGKKIELNLPKILSYREFREVLVHELGHIIDLGVLQGNSNDINTIYTEFGEAVFAIDDPSLDFYALSRENEQTRRAQSTFKDFVSGYGMTDPFEDFAETSNFYLHHYEAFEYLSTRTSTLQKKFLFMKNLYGENYISSSAQTLSNVKLKTDFLPRDTTRIVKQ